MKYFKRIDGLRFIAISLVLIEHFARAIGKYFSAGFYGVELFFVISGFLITSILLKPNKNSLRSNYIHFIGRRTLRIFPIYYLTIAILWVSDFPIVREHIIWLVTFSYNYALIACEIPNTPINHFWSLGIEEQFYLFWPILVLSLKNQPRKLLYLVLLIIFAGYTQLAFEIIPILSKYNDVAIFPRMATLAVGTLGAILVQYYTLPKRFFQNKYIEFLVFIILIASLLTELKLKVFTLGFASLYLVLKAAYFNFSWSYLDQFLRNKIVIHIGVISISVLPVPIDDNE